MRLVFITSIALLILCACESTSEGTYLQAEAVQLSRPVIHLNNYFFTDSTTVRVGPTAAGSKVYVSTFLESPTSEHLVVDVPLTVTESATLKFRTFGGDFLPSDEVTIEVLKLHSTSVSISAASPPTAPYDKVSQGALTDQRKANKNFRTSDWLGYQDSIVTFSLSFPETEIRGIILSVLEDQGSWIFAPSVITAVFYDSSGQQLREETINYDAATQKNGSFFRLMTVRTESLRATSVQLQVESPGAIPAWHPGAGSKPWLFVDEILLR